MAVKLFESALKFIRMDWNFHSNELGVIFR